MFNLRVFSAIFFCIFCQQIQAMPNGARQECNDFINFSAEVRNNAIKFKPAEEVYQSYISKDIFVSNSDGNLIRSYLKIKNASKYTESTCIVLLRFDREIAPHIGEVADDFMRDTYDLYKSTMIRKNDLDEKLIKGEILFNDFEMKSKDINDAYLSRLNGIYFQLDLAIDDLKSGKKKVSSGNYKNRESARNDVVAQVLNYSSGVAEDASGDAFFYPVNNENGQCIYKISINTSSPSGRVLNQLMGDVLQADKFMSANGLKGGGQASSLMDDGIDLNKGDLKNINFYKLQGAKRNKFTGTTAYLRYQSRIEGLPDLFECDSNSCNMERLKRGWALVQSKCKGTKKAF